MPDQSSVTYKDVQIPRSLLGLIDHMESVEEYREELRSLAAQWDLLTILGQMNGTGTDMSGTREGFKRLTNELLSQLGLEYLRKATREIGAKAQVAVDILIRNLFERTADIGFLATDDDVRQFIRDMNALKPRPPYGQGGEQEGVNRTESKKRLQEKIVDRFQEYVDKYSVYFNIVLMDTDGAVLAQLDNSSGLVRSTDPIVKEALTTQADYVEAFRHSDLTPHLENSLIYAYRVTESNDSKSAPLGVLCLCFRFKNEMKGIFKNLQTANDWSVMTILDRSGRVIASSDRFHVPLGAQMEMVLSGEYGLVKFAGGRYLAKTCATKGYQGYFGQGWYGHVMMPIDHAFHYDSDGAVQTIAEDVLEAILSDPHLFSEELRGIPLQADKIQGELERTVWNGNVREQDTQAKVLLWSISDAGVRTKRVFEKSIGNLHETVVDSMMSNVHFWAVLAVDIMDRNLYERANDCRWWALTSAFREILSAEHITDQAKSRMTGILEYINGLYTVYTNLFVYDINGRICAVSNPAESYLVGTQLHEDWVRMTLSLKDSQDYSVSPFDATDLYAKRHTYVYGAGITSLTQAGKVLGGIGIVFDSEPQFSAMIHDALPRDEKGEVISGCFGVFAGRSKRIISSTHPDQKPGMTIDVPDLFFHMDNGAGQSRIIEYQGTYYAVGAHTSAGYREYKTQDSYKNDVIALVFVPLAAARPVEKEIRRRRNMDAQIGSSHAEEDSIEVATFFIGDKWLGVKVEHVVEAINPDGLTMLPGTSKFIKGRIMYHDMPILVVDIRSVLELPAKEVDAENQIIVLRSENATYGLLVDNLGEIPQISRSRVDDSKHVLENSCYTECLVKPEVDAKNKEMLVVLNPNGVIKKLKTMDVR